MLKTNREIAKETRENNHLSDKQKQLVLGALLGDGGMFVKENGKRGVQLCHGDDQIEYLEWKKEILGNFLVQKSPSGYCGGYGKFGNNYRTITHQDFTDIYGMLYRKLAGKSKKFVTRRYLNNINDFGLMVWFMDDGGVAKDKDIRIATNGFSLSENKSIQKWLWQRYGIETNISFNSSNKTYFLRFNVLNSKKLMRLFEKYIRFLPDCILYKFRFHFNLNDYTLNSYASTDIRTRMLKI